MNFDQSFYDSLTDEQLDAISSGRAKAADFAQQASITADSAPQPKLDQSFYDSLTDEQLDAISQGRATAADFARHSPQQPAPQPVAAPRQQPPSTPPADNYEEYKKSYDPGQDTPFMAGLKAFGRALIPGSDEREEGQAVMRDAVRRGGAAAKTAGYAADLVSSFAGGIVGAGGKIAQAAGHLVGQDEWAKDVGSAAGRYFANDMTETAPVGEDGEVHYSGVGQRIANIGKSVAGMMGEFLPATIANFAGGAGALAFAKGYTQTMFGAGAINAYNETVDFAKAHGVDDTKARVIGAAAGAADYLTNFMFVKQMKKDWIKDFTKTEARKLIFESAKSAAIMGVGGSVQDSIRQMAENGEFDIKRTGDKLVDGLIEGALFHMVNHYGTAGCGWVRKAMGVESPAEMMARAKAAKDEQANAANNIADEYEKAKDEKDREESMKLRAEKATFKEAFDKPEIRARLYSLNPEAAKAIVGAKERGEDITAGMVNALIGGEAGCKFDAGNLVDGDIQAIGIRVFEDYISRADSEARVEQRRKDFDEAFAARDQDIAVASKKGQDEADFNRSTGMIGKDKTALLGGEADLKRTKSQEWEAKVGSTIEREENSLRAERMVEANPETYEVWLKWQGVEDSDGSRLQYLRFMNGQDYALDVVRGGVKFGKTGNGGVESEEFNRFYNEYTKTVPQGAMPKPEFGPRIGTSPSGDVVPQGGAGGGGKFPTLPEKQVGMKETPPALNAPKEPAPVNPPAPEMDADLEPGFRPVEKPAKGMRIGVRTEDGAVEEGEVTAATRTRVKMRGEDGKVREYSIDDVVGEIVDGREPMPEAEPADVPLPPEEPEPNGRMVRRAKEPANVPYSSAVAKIADAKPAQPTPKAEAPKVAESTSGDATVYAPDSVEAKIAAMPYGRERSKAQADYLAKEIVKARKAMEGKWRDAGKKGEYERVATGVDENGKELFDEIPDSVTVKVPGDGEFTVPNNPNGIAKLVKVQKVIAGQGGKQETKYPGYGNIPRPPSVPSVDRKAAATVDAAKKLVSPFVSTDKTRQNMLKPIVSDGKVMATSGRVAIEVDVAGAKGPEDSIGISKIIKTTIEGAKESVDVDIADAFQKMSQAAVAAKEYDKDRPVAVIGIGKDGKLSVFVNSQDGSRPSLGEQVIDYASHNAGDAKVVAAVNAEDMINALSALAKTGNRNAKIHFSGVNDQVICVTGDGVRVAIATFRDDVNGKAFSDMRPKAISQASADSAKRSAVETNAETQRGPAKEEPRPDTQPRPEAKREEETTPAKEPVKPEGEKESAPPPEPEPKPEDETTPRDQVRKFVADRGEAIDVDALTDKDVDAFAESITRYEDVKDKWDRAQQLKKDKSIDDDSYYEVLLRFNKAGKEMMELVDKFGRKTKRAEKKAGKKAEPAKEEPKTEEPKLAPEAKKPNEKGPTNRTEPAAPAPDADFESLKEEAVAAQKTLKGNAMLRGKQLDAFIERMHRMRREDMASAAETLKRYLDAVKDNPEGHSRTFAGNLADGDTRYSRRADDPEVRDEVQRGMERIGKLVPGVKFRTAEEGELPANSPGAYNRSTGEVVLGKDADLGTLVHEMGFHAVRQLAERSHPELLQRLVRYAESAPKDVRDEVFRLYGEDYARELERNGRTAAGDLLLDEIGALRFELVGRKAFREALNATPEARTWKQGMMARVKKLFGLAGDRIDVDSRKMRNLSDQEYVDSFMKQMFEGRRLEGETRYTEPMKAYSAYTAAKAEISPEDVQKAIDEAVGADPERLRMEREMKEAKAAHDEKVRGRAKAAAEDAMRYSRVTPEEDREYEEAIRNGQLTAANKMVLDAVKRAMPNTKAVDEKGMPVRVFHGTVHNGKDGKPFTVFEPRGYTGGAGFEYYFNDNPSVGRFFSGNGAVFFSDPVEIFGKIKKGSVNDLVAFIKEYGRLKSVSINKISEDNIRLEEEYPGGGDSSSPLGNEKKYVEKLYEYAKRVAYEAKKKMPEKGKTINDWRTDYRDKKLNGGVYHTYLNIENPLVVDARGGEWSSFEFNGKKDSNVAQVSKYAKDNGYDGVIIRNVHETTTGSKGYRGTDYIVFSPKQIKSVDVATYDDAGKLIPLSQRFNPESEDMRYSRVPRHPNPNPGNYMDLDPNRSKKEMAKEAYKREIVDRFSDIKEAIVMAKMNDGMTRAQASDWAENSEDSIYHACRVKSGKVEAGMQRVRSVLEGLTDSLKRNGIDINEFGSYCYAVHAPDRNAQKLRDHGVENGSGMSDAEARAQIDAIPSSRRRTMEEMRRNFVNTLNREFGLDYMHGSGLTDQGSVNRLMDAYGLDFVNLMDDIVDGDGVSYDRAGSVANPLKNAKGRHSLAENPAVFMLLGMQSNIINAQENIARAKLAEFIEGKRGADGRWEVEPHPEMGVVRRLRPNDRVDDTMITFRRNDRIRVDGTDNYEEMNNRYVIDLYGDRGAQMVSALTEDNVSRGPKWLAASARAWASFATQLSPTFTGRNFIKDTMEVTMDMLSTGGFGMARRFLAQQMGVLPGLNKEMKRVFKEWQENGKVTGNSREARFFREFAENGGLIGGGGAREGYANTLESLESLTRKVSGAAAIKHGIKAFWDKYVHVVGNLNERIEMLTRFNNYMVRREGGEEIGRAIINSREGSTDFGMYGNQRWMNNIQMFSTSILGGTVRAGKSLVFGRFGRKVAAGLITLGFLEEMADVALNGADDDDREKKGEGTGRDVTEYELENSLHLRYGGKYVKMPMHLGPYTLLKYFGNNLARCVTGKITMEQALKNVAGSAATIATHLTGTGEHPLDQGGKALFNSFMPSVMVQPISQVVNNTDYKGQKIYREHDYPGSKDAPDYLFAKESTSPMWVQLSRIVNKIPFTGGTDTRKGKLDIAPEALEYLANQVFKNFGKDFTQAAALPAKMMSSESDEDFTVKDVPFARDFVKNTPNVSSRYYETFNRVKADMDELKRVDPADRAAFLKEHPLAGGQLKKMSDTITELVHRSKGHVKSKTGKWIPAPSPISQEARDAARDKSRELMARYIQIFSERSGR